MIAYGVEENLLNQGNYLDLILSFWWVMELISLYGMIIGILRVHYLKFGHTVIYDSTSSVDAKLASVVQDGNWNWGYARPENLVASLSKLPLIEFVDIDKA